MKVLITILLTALIAAATSHASAATPTTLLDAEVRDLEHLEDPGAVREAGWLAFVIPATAGTTSVCCWQGRWSTGREVACSLQATHQSQGSHSDSPPADQLHVFAERTEQGVERLMLVGSDCPVEAGGESVAWLGDVDDHRALDWLQSLASSDEHHAGSAAAWALAVHASPEATQRLVTLAKQADGSSAHQALFWLGASLGSSDTAPCRIITS